MRVSRALAAVLFTAPLLAAPALRADTHWWSFGSGAPATPVPAPQPTPDRTPLSSPPVTPDPTFTDAAYAFKWPHITLAECQRLLKDGAVLVDGRSKLEWDQSHLPGALPLTLGDFDKYYPKYEHRLKRAKILISYCHGKGCRLSDALAQKLVDKGFKNVAVFWGGFPEWSGAHLPLYDKDGKRVKD